MSPSLRWFLPCVAAMAACQGQVTGPDRSAATTTTGAGSGGSGGSTPVDETPAGALTLTCDAPNLGKPVLRLLNSAEVTRTIDSIFPGIQGKWTNTLPASTVSAYGFDNDSAATVGPQLASALLDTATGIATAVTTDALANLLPCAASSPDRACIETFLGQYGKRLFRRTLTSTEHDRYLAFFDSAVAKSDFKSALKWITVGLIQSPNALYRSEIGAVDGDGTRHLSAGEIATELAYTYTGTTPTADLLAKAETGSLDDVVTTAKTMITGDTGKQALHHFFEGYLDYVRVASIEKAGLDQFPAVRGDMVKETRAFIDDVVFQKRGGFGDLLTSPTTYPSQALASFYGFPSPANDFAPTARPAGRGIGLLAQGSILASRAQPDGSSPTKRGLLVFSRLLCEEKPSPPANVPALPVPIRGSHHPRALRAEHAMGSCQNCHKLFDPIGFGFEHFDQGGRYRQDEGGLAINTASHVPDMDGATIFEFQTKRHWRRGSPSSLLHHNVSPPTSPRMPSAPESRAWAPAR